MRKNPIADYIFITILMGVFLFVMFLIARCVSADDGSLDDAVNRVVGTKVRDAGDYSVQYVIKDTPTGQRVYDREGNWLYKVEDSKIYNMKREPVYGIEKDKAGKK